jgi:PAS domain S-box-containing protein/putative nucleotidyltransferase with HDIG domain
MAEKILRDSEESYRDLVEKAGIAILTDDQEGNFNYCNARYAELFGYSLAEMKKQSIRSIVHPDDVERVMKYHKGRQEEKKVPSRYEFKGIRKDGSTIYVEVDVVVLKEDDKLVGTRSYLWDITERKKAEEALLESEERFRSVVENSHEGILILDDNYYLIYCNEELCRISGYSRKEIIGQDFRKFLDEESVALAVDYYRQRQRGVGPPPRYEFTAIHKSGEKKQVEISACVIRDASGRAKTVIQVLNITERKKAEEKIQETLKMLRKALNGTIEAIALTVEARDSYTSGHQRRVADLAQAIAGEMGLSQEQIDGIHMAGIIHDLGKISIPADILSKSSRLNDNEFALIKSHPQVGYEILKQVEFPWPIAKIVLQHHERMDGSGYPQGLSNGNISLEARILAVADIVEAMSSYRPYRPALGIDKALEEISKNKGILYDPEVVDACQKLFLEKAYKFK